MNLHSRLVHESREGGWLFTLTVVTAFLAGVLSILQAFQLSRVLSGVFIVRQSLTQVMPLLRLILGTVLLRALFTLLNEVMAGRLVVNVKNRLRQLVLQKIDRLGPEFLKNERTGELTTTALQGMDALDAYFSQFLPQIMISFMLPLTILVIVFPLDLLTGVILLVTLPLIPIFMVLIGKAAEAQTSRQWKAFTQLGNYFLDTLQGIATLKMLGRNKERAREIRDISERYRQITLNVLRISFLSALVLELISTLSTAVVAVEVGLRLLYGQIEFQQAIFILLVAPEFYLPLRNLSLRYHSGMTGVTAASSIFTLLDTPEPAAVPSGDVTRLESSFSGDFILTIQNLSHIYRGHEEYSLADINLELQKGKHYALVGESGSGKSTLARTLVRFIEPEKGRILLNSEDIRAWSKEQWRSYVGWLPQTPFMFNDTLLQNVTLGDDGFSLQEVFKAINLAGLSATLKELPQGLETPLLEGGFRFSGGELQRVALARIFLRNPKILIMDEPTAHLDIELEQSLEDSLNQLKRSGCTTVVIAHRLSTIQRTDEVLFMEKGRLAAQGTHIELLSSSQRYFDFIFPARSAR